MTPNPTEAREAEVSTVTGRPLWKRALSLTIGVGLVVGFAAFVLSATGGSSGNDEGPEVGAIAPDFVVPTLDGGEFSLAGHLEADGRPVFLNLWASWCFPCREEMPAIDAAAERHPEVHFIGVVVDDDEAPAREFVGERNIGYEIGVDDDRVVKDAYRVWAMPSTYLIAGDGTIVQQIFGPMDLEELEELISHLAAPG